MGITNQSVADNVDLKKAKEVGAYYMAVQSGQKSLNSDDLNLVYQIPNAQMNIPAIYFFNTVNGGFVMVAGTDCMDPIIGYSTEGTFDPNNIPPSMMAFLNGYVQSIVYSQNNNLTPSADIQKTWDELVERRLPEAKDGEKTIYGTMSSTWDQSYPYNTLSPYINGTQSPTGCVATALAQIIHYWEYPHVGNGYTAYEISTGEMLHANFGETYYDYSLMPDTLKPTSSAAEIYATSLLNFHVGVAVNMGFGEEGSSAQSSDCVKALKKYFKYDASQIRTIDRTKEFFLNNSNTPNAKDTLWVDTCVQEIKAHRPIYYSARDLSSSGTHAGHAFVMERYNSGNGKVWFNWGWGGYSDCWCNLYTSKLNAGGYNFTDSHYAIIGITPPADSLVAISHVEVAADAPAYPNPANTIITIPYTLNGANSATMQVYNMEGKLVDQRVLSPEGRNIRIDVTNYPKGVYVYRYNGKAQRFVVQ